MSSPIPVLFAGPAMRYPFDMDKMTDQKPADMADVAGWAGAIALVGFILVATAQASNMILARGLAGSVPPFALNPDLAIVVDQDLLANDTLFFNAGRLDRSMELDAKDWLAVARPRVAKIAVEA